MSHTCREFIISATSGAKYDKCNVADFDYFCFVAFLLKNWRRLTHQKRFALGMNKRLALGAKWTFVAVFVWGARVP